MSFGQFCTFFINAGWTDSDAVLFDRRKSDPLARLAASPRPTQHNMYTVIFTAQDV